MSPTPDNTSQDNNGTSVVMATPPSAVPTAVPTAAERAAAAAVENPYLAGLGKKTRGLKKKLEKIRKTESFSKSGKHLNEEQLKLLETKPLLEVALAEHERVRGMIETVAREQAQQQEAQHATLSASPLPQSTTSHPPAALSIAVSTPQGEALSIPAADSANISVSTANPAEAETRPREPKDHDGHGAAGEQQKGAAEQTAPAVEPACGAPVARPPMTVHAATAAVPSTESVGVATDTPESSEAGAQTDVSGPPPPRGLDPQDVAAAMAVAGRTAEEEKQRAVEEAEARGLEAGRAEAVGTGVSKLLRLLHVASRFEAKGERLPSAVDFFSKVLLGKTVPPDEADFDGCLDQSVERAVLYLNPESSSREVAPGVNFQRLEEIVSALRDQIVAPPPASQAPVFNFFGDASPPRQQQRDGESRREGEDQDGETAAGSVPSTRPPTNGNEQTSSLSTPVPPATGGVPNGVSVAQNAAGFQAALPPGGDSADDRSMVLPLPGPLLPPPAQSMVASGASGGSGNSAVSGIAPSSQGAGAGDEREADAVAIRHRERHHERQPSEMEEGVLPPVVSQAQLAAPPAAASSARSALPQREPRVAKSRPRPVQNYPQAPLPPTATHYYTPHPQQSGMVSPPLPHPLHVQSPFQQQPTPPLTPVTIAQGMAPPVPSLSPPEGTLPSAGGPRGSPNQNYNGGGWGYPQPLPPPQAPLISQQHQHQQPYQQHANNRLPVHPNPASMERGHDQPTVGPPWGDTSPPMYPAALTAARSTPSPPLGGTVDRTQETLVGGFSLARDNVQVTPSVSRVQQQQPPPPPPAGPPPAAMTMPNTSPPTKNVMRPPGQGQWSSANGNGAVVGSAVPAASQPAANVLDLERGMTSPWQGLPQDAGTAPAAPADAPGGGRSNGTGLGEDARVAGQQQQQQQQPSQVLSSNVNPAAMVQGAPPTLAESSPDAKGQTSTNNSDVVNGTGADASAGGDTTVGTKGRSGNGRGRGPGSRTRGRGRGRGEARVDDRKNSTAGHGAKVGDDQPSNKQQSAAGSGASERAVVTTAAQQQQQQQQQQAPKQVQAARQDHAPRQDHGQRSGKPQRRPREHGRGQAHKPEHQQAASSGSVGVGQKQTSSPVIQPQHPKGRTSSNNGQINNSSHSSSNSSSSSNNNQSLRHVKNHAAGASPRAHTSKNGWSNDGGGGGGTPAAASRSFSQAGAQPPALPTQARAPSASWADDEAFGEPSPAPPQRTTGTGAGGRRSRQASHHKTSPSASVGDGQSSQQHTQESQGHGSTVSSRHDHGGRSNGHRQGSGVRSNGAVDANGSGGGGFGGNGVSKPRGAQQAPFHGRSGGSGNGNSNSERSQQLQGDATVTSGTGGGGRSKGGQDGSNGRMVNGGGDGGGHGSGMRKNRAPAANRRRGNGGGRGSQQQRQQQGAAQRS